MPLNDLRLGLHDRCQNHDAQLTQLVVVDSHGRLQAGGHTLYHSSCPTKVALL